MTADPTRLESSMHRETHILDMSWSVQRTLDIEERGSETPSFLSSKTQWCSSIQ